MNGKQNSNRKLNLLRNLVGLQLVVWSAAIRKDLPNNDPVAPHIRCEINVAIKRATINRQKKRTNTLS